MDNFQNNLNIIKIIFKFKKLFLIVIVAAIILSGVLSSSFFIAPRYKSTAVVYPGNISPYSDESETEQMLQMLNSSEFLDSLDQKYNLGEHYGLSKNDPIYYSTLQYIFGERSKIAKTPYESIEVSIEDTNPKQAYDMVNDIMNLYNNKISRLHKGKLAEVVEMYNVDLKARKHQLDSLKTILKDLGTQYGMIDLSTQSEEITKGLLRTINGNNAANINTKEVNKLKNAFEENSGNLTAASGLLKKQISFYATVNDERNMNARFLNSELTYFNMVSAPKVADKKSYPVRWLIVLGVSAAAFLLTLISLLIVENKNYFLKN